MGEKKTVSAKEVVADIKAGMSDEQLMTKYQLSANVLRGFLDKLLEAGLVTQAELDRRTSMSEHTALDLAPSLTEAGPLLEVLGKAGQKNKADGKPASNTTKLVAIAASAFMIGWFVAELVATNWLWFLVCLVVLTVGWFVPGYYLAKSSTLKSLLTAKYLAIVCGVLLASNVLSYALRSSPRDTEVVTPGHIHRQGSQVEKRQPKQGLSPTVDTRKQNEINQELVNAARHGDIERMKRALQLGADVNCCKNTGGPPLNAAAFNVEPEAVKFLLDHGADVNGQNNLGRTALHVSVTGCSNPKAVQVVKLLLDHGADTNIADNKGYPPGADAFMTVKFMFRACKPMRDLIMSYVENQGVFMPLPDREYQKALHLYWRTVGISGKHLDDIEYAIAIGADVNCCRDFGKGTPLQEAAFFTDLEAVRYLLDAGAEINLQGTQDGETALHKAVHSCTSPDALKVVELLLERGADLSIKNRKGITPLDLHTSDAGLNQPCIRLRQFLGKYAEGLTQE